MKHPVSLILACILFFGGVVMALFPPARYIGACAAAVAVLALAAFVILELPILRGAHTDADPKADYIVVLGAQVRGTEPSWSMHDRLTAALDYLNAYPESKAVVSGGQGPDEGCSEAEAMQTWLIAQGVAPERILLEDQSESTQENLSNSFAIIAADGGDVTHERISSLPRKADGRSARSQAHRHCRQNRVWPHARQLFHPRGRRRRLYARGRRPLLREEEPYGACERL